MSAFTDQVEKDLSAFIPLTGGRGAEFDQVRDIDGVQVAGVLDADAEVPDPETGIFNSLSTLHVRQEDLPAVPVIRQRLVIDGKPANVIKVDEAMGMLSIRLQWYES